MRLEVVVFTEETYLGSGDDQLHLSPSSANQNAEFFTDALQQRQSVVLSQCEQEVLDRIVLVLAASVFL